MTEIPADLAQCPHSDGNSCEQYRLQGKRCQYCPLLKIPADLAKVVEEIKNRSWDFSCHRHLDDFAAAVAPMLAERDTEIGKLQTERGALRRCAFEAQEMAKEISLKLDTFMASNAALTAEVLKLRAERDAAKTILAGIRGLLAWPNYQPYRGISEAEARQLVRMIDARIPQPAPATQEAAGEVCPVCNGAGRILHMWTRPGGPPGNGYATCDACQSTGSKITYDARQQQLFQGIGRKPKETSE